MRVRWLNVLIIVAWFVTFVKVTYQEPAVIGIPLNVATGLFTFWFLNWRTNRLVARAKAKAGLRI
jgi:hypothetical protein